MYDDRLDRMMRDPEAYWAEAEARARKAIEEEIRRELLREKARRRQFRRAFWSRWLWWLR